MAVRSLAHMSSKHAAKAVLARNIDEDNAPNYNLLISYASSLPTSRLLSLHEWLKANSPTGAYTGPKPTYRLKFDWSGGDEPVEVVNRALEQCFGTRGMIGWEIWIRGDQLNLLSRDFRKEYLRLRELEDPEVGILDIWVDVLLDQLKRISQAAIRARWVHPRSSPTFDQPHLNPSNHSMLAPNPTSSQRSGRRYFNVLSEDEATPCAKANREGPLQEREESEVEKDGEWDDGDVLGTQEERETAKQGKTPTQQTIDEESGEDRPRQKEGQDYKPRDGTDSDEEDDDVEEEDTPQQAMRRKPARRGAKTAKDADVSGRETAPIWVDHGPGPSRRRQTAREMKQKKSAKSHATEPRATSNFATTGSSRPAQANTAVISKVDSKRKGEDHQPNTKSKRPRVHQLTRALPNTPDGNSTATTQATPDTGASSGTGTERGTEVETPTPQARGGIRAPIWDYFIFISVDEKGNQR
ncbi:hypothetical protein QFC22_006761 [Naganishia vaughanmartiniae]|uniref:Uncharacterized protein n=1 Tax=Naganishia vaughanmartiniae TaxID=1424756 RepID=A0ACC2WEN5_9TREE|nr:hypothetical protein QFC22_006761 [Naganishia vaughanmartiniae]